MTLGAVEKFIEKLDARYNNGHTHSHLRIGVVETAFPDLRIKLVETIEPLILQHTLGQIILVYDGILKADDQVILFSDLSRTKYYLLGVVPNRRYNQPHIVDMPIKTWDFLDGAVAYSSGTGEDNYSGASLPEASATPKIRIFARIPESFVDNKAPLLAVTFTDNHATPSGNIVLKAKLSLIVDNMQLAGESVSQTIAVPATQHHKKTVYFIYTTKVNRLDFLHLRLIRDSNNAADTSTDDIVVTHCGLTYKKDF